MTEAHPLVLAISSGKGGVGKTNVAVNLAATLAKDSKVILLDADLGLANVDVLLGLTPPHDLMSIFNEDVSLKDVLFPTPYGFSILPSPSGLEVMNELTAGQKLELLDAMDEIADGLDYLIVDTGAGISDSMLYFSMAAQERLVVINPEPTSISDAYALIKVLKLSHGIEHFRVCVNMAPDMKTARQLFKRLCEACDQFIGGASLDLAGVLPRDVAVRKAVMQQKPFTILEPECEASQSMAAMALKVPRWRATAKSDGNIKFFWQRLLFN